MQKKGSIIYSNQLDYKSIKVVYDFKTSEEGQLVSAALLLRRQLQNTKKRPWNDPLDIDSLRQGSCEVPELVTTFFRVLFSGKNRDSDTIKRRAMAASEDAVFNVHNGQLVPKKHILLANLVNSLTGSRKVMTVLNRLGHCVSYSMYEELQTELAVAIQNRELCSPKGAKRGAVMGNAFDNYDEIVHTLSGVDSLHDTMGIFYQNIESSAETIESHALESECPPTPSRRKRKRTLPNECLPNEPMPYRKKPRMTEFDYPAVNYNDLPRINSRAQKLDTLFLLNHIISDEVPMWIGYNASLHSDLLPKQVVHYMPNLNLPITKHDTVAQTMRRSQKCADECAQKYGLVTYDLDVAKTARKIQITNQPEFDNLFIMFGAFHLQMCFFRAMGKVIEESGGPAMLTDSGVLAPSSLRGFLECLNFNRCKRLHPLLALGMEILLFRRFMQGSENSEFLLDELTTFDWKSCDRDEVCKSQLFLDVFESFEKLKDDAETGALGKTAQFWTMYIRYIQIYHNLERAIRETDLDLFITTLTPMTDLFFATNRQNYARWMSKYQLDLMNIDNSHPGLRRILDNGGFSIRRSDNHFSRIPIDLTLEQTINADAASRLTGYTSSTDNYNARVRWCITKSSRAALVSDALSMVGLDNANHSNGLSSSRIERDNNDLQKIVKQIESCINPFSLEHEAALVNISTGKVASDTVTSSLLCIPADGKERHQAFVTECVENAGRFEKPIRRRPIHTFASECIANRKLNKESKEAQLKCTTQLLGRIAFIAATTDIDLEYIFSFPLTPVPLTMCRGDGTMVHTEKSKLLAILEDTVNDHSAPKAVRTHIIDGNFLLHCMSPDQPETYGGLSRNILIACLAHNSQRIDVIFDTYERPSIKDLERNRRNVDFNRTELVIDGPSQKRDSNFKKQLERESFKRNLPLFLAKDWSRDEYGILLEGKELYLGVMEDCTRYFVEGGKVCTESVPSLSCNHAEADTRVILHMIQSSRSMNGDIVIRASDTDILVLAVHHLHRVTSPIWMETGNKRHGNLRYINATKIAATIGQRLCGALPGLHAFTGCDYTSAFLRHGKSKPYAILKMNEEFQRAFASLSSIVPTEKTIKTLQYFVATLYGAKGSTSLNKHRFNVVEKTYNHKGKAPFSKLKSIAGSSIPPCEAELAPHIDRCAFVAKLWGSAHRRYIDKTPTKGWDVIENEYRVVWYYGEQFPSSFLPHIPDDLTVNDSDDDDNHDEIESDSEDGSDAD